MQKYLFVSEDEAYTREYIKDEEYKASNEGALKIYHLDQDNGVVEEYQGTEDGHEFNEVRRTF